MKKSEARNPKDSICGVCGEQLLDISGKYACRTCERFFWKSGLIVDCAKCGRKFASYPAVEEKVAEYTAIVEYKKWKLYCPVCRKDDSKPYSYGTVCELIRDIVEKRTATPRDLVMLKGLPREFVEFCLGRVD